MTAPDTLRQRVATAVGQAPDARAVERALAVVAAEVASALKADWSRYRGHVLCEVWEALRDAEDGPLIDGMHVVNNLMERR